MNYVDPQILREFAEAPESDTGQIWEQLAQSASRLFDRACDVEDDFFAPAPTLASEQTYRMNGTAYLKIKPYIKNSIETVKDIYGGTERIIIASDYSEQDGYLIFDSYYSTLWSLSLSGKYRIKVRARFGFPAIPADVKQAVIEQALLLWRRKDTAFTELSGVSTAVAQAAYSPTFQVATEKYRALYSGVVIG